MFIGNKVHKSLKFETNESTYYKASDILGNNTFKKNKNI